MKKISTNIKDAFIIEVDKFDDKRGFFMESFNQREIDDLIGRYQFVQDNHSRSTKGVLRGLHYQTQHVQGKLVRCIQGSVYDVMVDIRKNSDTFGKWFGIELNRSDLLVWVPPGLAHGFYTLSNTAEFQYKTTDYYDPESQRSIIWNDKFLNIDWLNTQEPIVSDKDMKGKTFEECEKL